MQSPWTRPSVTSSQGWTVKRRLSYIALCSVLLVFLCGIMISFMQRFKGGNGTTDRNTKECLRRMANLEGSASSYSMVHRCTLDDDDKIAPQALKDFLVRRDWTRLFCPEGGDEYLYEPFTLREGIRCPYSQRHNQLYKQERWELLGRVKALSVGFGSMSTNRTAYRGATNL